MIDKTTRRASLVLLLLAMGCSDDADAGPGMINTFSEGDVFVDTTLEETNDSWLTSIDTFRVFYSKIAVDDVVVFEDDALPVANLALISSTDIPSGDYNTLFVEVENIEIIGTASKDDQTISFDFTVPGVNYTCDYDQYVKGNQESGEAGGVILFWEISKIFGSESREFQSFADSDSNMDGVLSDTELAELTGEVSSRLTSALLADETRCVSSAE